MPRLELSVTQLATNNKPVLIIETGKTYAQLEKNIGGFGQWIQQGLGDVQCQIIDAHSETKLPSPDCFAGVVISGSHDMVTDCHPWSEALADWIRQCAIINIPMLGICYGHQLIAHAMGGKVGFRQSGIEIGTHTIQLTSAAQQDPLFNSMPNLFPAHLVHSQSVTHLPDNVVILATSEQEPHQSYRIGETIWGVQFHPEFSTSVMNFYLDAHQTAHIEIKSARARTQAAHQGKQAAYQGETEHAQGLLKKFAELTGR